MTAQPKDLIAHISTPDLCFTLPGFFDHDIGISSITLTVEGIGINLGCNLFQFHNHK